MSDAFTVLWTHERCRALRKAGKVGERPPTWPSSFVRTAT